MKNEIIEIIASVAEVPVKNVKMESNLINDLEKQASEEAAIEYVRTLYKEAEF